MRCSICKEPGHTKRSCKITTSISASKNDSEIDVNIIPEGMTSQVLELCSLPACVNLEEMRAHINTYMASRVAYYRDKKRAPFIEDEFSEYYTAKTTGGIEIGGGSCAMDVQTKNNEGIDAMCVVMKKSGSNEKSLIQNFGASGSDLDTLFKEKKDGEAVQLYVLEYSKKLQDVKKEKGLGDLYILAFVSTNEDVFLVSFKLNLENIKDVSSGGFVKNKGDVKNIIINNFINPAYGNVKLYKSKKRMELRLLPDVLKSELVVKIFTMP